MENVTTPGQIIFLFVLFFVFCAVAGWWLFSGPKEQRTPVDFEPMAIIGDTWRALLHWRPVKRSSDNDASLMSRSEEMIAPSMPSSLQTDGAQTPDQTVDPVARRQKLLDTYRPLRKLGMSRDDARAFLNAVGVPLDNNIWADAAPQPTPIDADYRTPIVGRPTSARFETDPDFPYQAPA